MTRGNASNVVVQMAQGVSDFDDTCLDCHRNTAWLHHSLHLLLVALSQLFFLGADAGPFAVPTPWAYVDSASHNKTAIFLMAHFGSRVLLILPVYFLCCLLFKSYIHRIVYIIAMLALLGGWPAVLVNIVFQIGGYVVNWPPSYYLFPHQIFNFDWASVGFVHLLVIALLSKHDSKWWAGPLYAAFGQVMMDNLGMVAGICFFLAWLYRRSYRGIYSISPVWWRVGSHHADVRLFWAHANGTCGDGLGCRADGNYFWSSGLAWLLLGDNGEV